jgi:hypothetical protein
VTLNEGRNFHHKEGGFNLTNVLLDAESGTISFDLKTFTPVGGCVHYPPRIATGLFGEYRIYVDFRAQLAAGTRSRPEELDPYAHATPRMGFFTVNFVEGLDVGCPQKWSIWGGDQHIGDSYAINVRALPTGWEAFAPTVRTLFDGNPPYAEKVPFALTIPEDAKDGNYDMCVTAYNINSGYVTAKPFRVTLPETKWDWWTNNRPAYYENLAVDCSQYIGCLPDSKTCTWPVAESADEGVCAQERSTPQ